MKPPPPMPRARAASVSRRNPRSRTEAAIALVRAEFERERFQREISMLDHRSARARAGRRDAAMTSGVLRAFLADRSDTPARPDTPLGKRR